MSDWALATTYPNTEFRVASALHDRGLPFHFFTRRLLTAHRGTLRERLVPAFPRYIFVPFAACWELLRDISDIVSIVMFEKGKAASVRQPVIEKLVSLCVDGVLAEPATAARFNAGDEITVTGIDGMLSQKGRFHHDCGDGRSVVLLDWMGREVFVSVNDADLSKPKLTENKRKRRRRKRNKRNQSPIQAHSSSPATA